MPTSPCACGTSSSRNCTAPASPPSTRRWNARWSPVLARMERHGIKVDRATLGAMSGKFAQKMAALEAEIHELAGRSFNVGSPKQLGEILFDEMGYEGGKKGKTGAYATGADVLEDLATPTTCPREGAGLAAAVETQIDLHGRAAGPYRPRYGPRAHLLRADRGGDRAALVDRSQPAEHPHPHRGRAAASARRSSPRRAIASSASTIPRSSCASSPISHRSTR